MPINEFGIGVSEETQQKQRHFEGLITYLSTAAIGAYKNIQKKNSVSWIDDAYWIFDLYAARPTYYDNSGNQIFASSIIGPSVVKDVGWGERIKINLFEISETNAESLAEYYKKNPNARVFQGDNKDNLGRVMRHKKQRFGYLYVDPNKPQVPLDVLDCFYAQNCNSRVDLIINVAVADLKRGICSPRYVGLPDMVQFLQKRKKFWLIREPSKKHQWTFLVGTNWMEVKGWTKEGFYRLDSEEGNKVMEEVGYTKMEQKQRNQPQLFS